MSTHVKILGILHVVFGAVLGVYGLWVLLSTGSEQLFYGPPAPVARA